VATRALQRDRDLLVRADFIEDESVKCPKAERRRLVMVLNTPGGVAEAVEKMVEVIRKHFDHVTFVVPDHAMSAGTILCMSGDRILMDYSSSLGPVDPQVQDNAKTAIPAMGYLDEVETMIAKSNNGTLSDAELMMLQRLDLGRLNAYKSAKELTITLLKDWLVRFKFKTWRIHRSDPAKLDQEVTEDEKLERPRRSPACSPTTVTGSLMAGSSA
jgi:membrane-bound ClpP family serine protease